MLKRPASIKVRALQWLAQREHSRSELRGKLLRLLDRPRRSDPDGDEAGHVQADHARADRPVADHPVADPQLDAATEVDALLDWLVSHGHLSQERFIESRVHARQRRYGNLRIQQELKQHGSALDADALQALKASEYQRALQVWQRKFGVTAVDATGRVRQMRFLTGRGFTSDVIRQVLRDQVAAGAADTSREPDEAG